jgi:hypothetical protein
VTPGLRLLGAAALVGLVHAGFSAYWAAGGDWLLDTVGQWAVDLAARSPGVTALGLGAVALAKAAGAVVPVMSETGRIGGRRPWRALGWLGGLVLILYGCANSVVAWLVLAGVIEPEGGYDERAMLGHAALWDPLFAAWGALLVAGLAVSRGTPPGRAAA